MAKTREQMIAELQAIDGAQQQISLRPTREQMIAELKAQHETAPDPDTETKANAALQGFGNAATFGYLPKAQAAIASLLPDPSAKADETLKSQGFQISEPDRSYGSELQGFKGRADRLEKEAPVASALGSIGGALSTAAVPGKALGLLPGVGKLFAAPAAGLLGKAGQAAATGALTGIASDSEDHLQGAKEGGLTGAAAEIGLGLLGKGGKVLAAIPKGLKDFAEERAVAGAGAFKSDVSRLLKKDAAGQTGDELRKLGRFALDENLIRPGDKIDNVAERIGQSLDDTGKKLSDLYSLAAEKGGQAFDTSSLAQEAIEAAKSKFKGKPGSVKAISTIQSLGEDLAANGASDIKTVQDFRRRVDDLIPYDKGRDLMSAPEKEALVDLRRFLSNKVKDHLDTLDPQYRSQLQNLNDRYGKLSELDRISRNRIASETGNNILSPTDKAALFGGIALGAGSGMHEGGDAETVIKRGLIGAGAGLASKAARSYGRPLLMKGADVASKALSGPGQMASSLVKGMAPKAAREFMAEASMLKDPNQVGALAAQFRRDQK